MLIDNKKFIDELRNRVIDLLDSGRGNQKKLSECIGKPSSFFSALKRKENPTPVNALHLKAIGIVFGPEKVLDLLDIENFQEKAEVTIIKHQDIVTKFIDQELGLENSERLIDIEKKDNKEYIKLTGYIQAIHNTVTSRAKKKEIQEPIDIVLKKKALKESPPKAKQSDKMTE